MTEFLRSDSVMAALVAAGVGAFVAVVALLVAVARLGRLNEEGPQLKWNLLPELLALVAVMLPILGAALSSSAARSMLRASNIPPSPRAQAMQFVEAFYSHVNGMVVVSCALPLTVGFAGLAVAMGLWLRLREQPIGLRIVGVLGPVGMSFAVTVSSIGGLVHYLGATKAMSKAMMADTQLQIPLALAGLEGARAATEPFLAVAAVLFLGTFALSMLTAATSPSRSSASAPSPWSARTSGFAQDTDPRESSESSYVPGPSGASGRSGPKGSKGSRASRRSSGSGASSARWASAKLFFLVSTSIALGIAVAAWPIRCENRNRQLPILTAPLLLDHDRRQGWDMEGPDVLERGPVVSIASDRSIRLNGIPATLESLTETLRLLREVRAAVDTPLGSSPGLSSRPCILVVPPSVEGQRLGEVLGAIASGGHARAQLAFEHRTVLERPLLGTLTIVRESAAHVRLGNIPGEPSEGRDATIAVGSQSVYETIAKEVIAVRRAGRDVRLVWDGTEPSSATQANDPLPTTSR